MPVNSTIRASFQSNVVANQAVNSALVGQPQHKSRSGPFTIVGTTVYSCPDADDIEVANALLTFSRELVAHAAALDSVFISLVRKY
jgi:hypothetical protein